MPLISHRRTGRYDRRKFDRFALDREVRYIGLGKRTTLEAGGGRTVDMSSGGILFTTDQPLTCDIRLELCVNWPVRLDNSCPLKLVALGRVVRTEGLRAALAIDKYEFRTQGSTFSVMKSGKGTP